MRIRYCYVKIAFSEVPVIPQYPRCQIAPLRARITLLKDLTLATNEENFCATTRVKKLDRPLLCVTRGESSWHPEEIYLAVGFKRWCPYLMPHLLFWPRHNAQQSERLRNTVYSYRSLHHSRCIDTLTIFMSLLWVTPDSPAGGTLFCKPHLTALHASSYFV